MLQDNEMRTRYALIDPVLRALGWDTENPEIVVPEYTTPTGRMDYALFLDNQVYIALEAKALRGDLASAREYWLAVLLGSNNIHFCLISDGDTWELHYVTVLSGKLIFNLQITKVPLGTSSVRLIAFTSCINITPCVCSQCYDNGYSPIGFSRFAFHTHCATSSISITWHRSY
ncbi:MAG: hypothetical protein KatS3mg016_0033 [Fimbriimonadales bacterium]|nr:MAG: hypothetical protein KatS3mg016_0033 [Fimbriimonadales bacterium]